MRHFSSEKDGVLSKGTYLASKEKMLSKRNIDPLYHTIANINSRGMKDLSNKNNVNTKRKLWKIFL